MPHKYDSYVHDLLYANRSLLIAYGIVTGDSSLIVRVTPLAAEMQAVSDALSRISGVMVALRERHTLLQASVYAEDRKRVRLQRTTEHRRRRG